METQQGGRFFPDAVSAGSGDLDFFENLLFAVRELFVEIFEQHLSITVLNGTTTPPTTSQWRVKLGYALCRVPRVSYATRR